MAQSTPRPPREPRSSARSTSSAPPPSRRRPPPRRPSSAGRVIVLIFLAVFGIGIGYLFGNKTARKYLPAIIHGENPFNHPSLPQLFGKPAINLMIIGHDYDYTDKDQVIRNASGRSDMLMVAHVDFVHQDAQLLSIPRDTRAVIPGHGVHKINAAHEFGGAPLAEETVLTNFGIPSDHYVTLDFDGFEKAIDELGGVDVVVDRKMDYDDNWGHLHIHLKPGLQHLNGQEAMGFVRFRHADSDFVRVKRQQTLLTALKDRLRDPLALMKIPEILDTLDQHIDSDLTTDQKVALAHFLHDLPRDKIAMDTLPSLDSSGTLVQTDWPKATPMIERIFNVTVPSNVASIGEPVRRHRHHYRRHAVAM